MLIKTQKNKNGKFWILSPPKEGAEYIAGQDPIPYNGASADVGSDHVIAIKDRIEQVYVAYYSFRSLNSELVMNDIIRLQEWYKSKRFQHGALCNIERNAGGVSINIYDKRGKLNLLSDRPSHLGIEYEDKKVTKGWYKNDRTEARGNKYLIDYLITHGEKIRFQRMIDELKRFPEGNNDLIDAVISCEVLDQELMEMDKKFIFRPKPPRQVREVYIDEGGFTQVRWVTK